MCPTSIGVFDCLTHVGYRHDSLTKVFLLSLSLNFVAKKCFIIHFCAVDCPSYMPMYGRFTFYYSLLKSHSRLFVMIFCSMLKTTIFTL